MWFRPIIAETRELASRSGSNVTDRVAPAPGAPVLTLTLLVRTGVIRWTPVRSSSTAITPMLVYAKLTVVVPTPFAVHTPT